MQPKALIPRRADKRARSPLNPHLSLSTETKGSFHGDRCISVCWRRFFSRFFVLHWNGSVAVEQQSAGADQIGLWSPYGTSSGVTKLGCVMLDVGCNHLWPQQSSVLHTSDMCKRDQQNMSELKWVRPRFKGDNFWYFLPRREKNKYFTHIFYDDA